MLCNASRSLISEREISAIALAGRRVKALASNKALSFDMMVSPSIEVFLEGGSELSQFSLEMS